MVMINEKFLNCYKLGESIAIKMAQGWKVTTVLEDRLGNGVFIFTNHHESCDVCVKFSEINEFDMSMIEWNKLGDVVRNY